MRRILVSESSTDRRRIVDIRTTREIVIRRAVNVSVEKVRVQENFVMVEDNNRYRDRGEGAVDYSSRGQAGEKHPRVQTSTAKLYQDHQGRSNRQSDDTEEWPQKLGYEQVMRFCSSPGFRQA